MPYRMLHALWQALDDDTGPDPVETVRLNEAATRFRGFLTRIDRGDPTAVAGSRYIVMRCLDLTERRLAGKVVDRDDVEGLIDEAVAHAEYRTAQCGFDQYADERAETIVFLRWLAERGDRALLIAPDLRRRRLAAYGLLLAEVTGPGGLTGPATLDLI